MSATTRILLGFVLVLAGALYFLGGKMLDRVERQYLEAAEEPMVDAAHLFASLIEQHVDESGTLDLATIRRAFDAAERRQFTAQIYNFTKTSLATNLYVTDRSGVVLFDSDAGRAEGQDYSRRRDVRLTLNGLYGARSTRTDEADELSSVMFVGAPIRHGREIVGVASVSKPQQSMFAFMDDTRRWMRWMGAMFFLAVALGAVLVTGWFARPIQRLTHYARAVARGERVAPPKLSSPEVARLGHAFEEMRDALEDRKYVEGYVQTLTHEMKSPVAAIRGAVELLREDMPAGRREKFLGNIQAEARRLQHLIDRMLALSAIETRKMLEHPEPVLLADLAGGVGAQVRSAADARGITVQVAVEGNPRVLGEPFLLEIALNNLLQNAIDFSPVGGLIRVEITTDPVVRAARIVVEDEGPGIPDYAVGRIFERFYSLQHPATGRKSSGLGLCFVSEAAQLHGGKVTVANRTDRSGARAMLVLPLDETAAG